MTVEITPTIVNVTAQGDGILSNDPLAAFDSAVFPFNTDLKDITNHAFVMQAQNGAAITTNSPKFGAGSLNITATNTATAMCAQLAIAQSGALDILSGTGDFCIDFWVKVSGAGGAIAAYGDTLDGSDATTFRLAFSLGTTGVSVNSLIPSPGGGHWANLTGAVLVANTWTHIAVVRSATKAKLYVNGVSTSPGTDIWTGFVFPTTFTPEIILGMQSAISGTIVPVQFDEFRITKGNPRYTANFTPPTAPTAFFALSQGYSNGFIGGDTFGAVNPNPALLDTDVIAAITVVQTGTLVAPAYAFQVSVEGEMLEGDLTSVSFTDGLGTPHEFDVANATFTLSADNTFGTWSWVTTGYLLATSTTTPVTLVFEDPNVEFNCDCEMASSYATLAELRIRMAIQCGYAAMSANLPTGQAIEFNEYLLSAQKQLYYKFRSQRTERFFRWDMVRGQRYYGLDDNSNICTARLDPLAVTWVGFEDLNKAWYRLIEGIDPVYYTRANINFGWPTRYEIRSCIEIFPAPQAAYTLWIKGDIGLAPFAADGDRPTFDDEAVLLFAVANWKSAKGKVDAERCMGQATQRIQDLTARKYGTARFVPSTYVQNPATPPRFLPLGNGQS